MMKDVISTVHSRRVFCLRIGYIFISLSAINNIGCSTLKGQKKSKEHDTEFEEDEEIEEHEEISVFDAERSKQDKLSEMLAQNGRKSKTRRGVIRPGDDFLLSDKAKEIYANTER